MTKKSKNRPKKLDVKGRRLNVTPMPSTINPVPWNALTVALRIAASADTTSCITIGDVLKLVVKQSNSADLGNIVIRIQSASLWEISGKSFNVTFGELVDGSQCASYADSMTAYRCSPSRMGWARVGYLWPVSNRVQVKSQAEGSTAIMRIALLKDSSLEFHVKLLWSFGVVKKEADSSSLFSSTTLTVASACETSDFDQLSMYECSGSGSVVC